MLNKDNLLWLDLEMTGLDPEKERIIEIAIIATDAHLNVLAEGPELVIHQPDSLLDQMDKWCVHQHGLSGLTDRVRASRVTEAEAEAAILAFARQYTPAGESPICGNTIGQDRRFLVKYMPELEAHFHYRNLDVSTIKELVKRWKPSVKKGFAKQGKHLAMDDIRDSIAELRFYREHFFAL